MQYLPTDLKIQENFDFTHTHCLYTAVDKLPGLFLHGESRVAVHGDLGLHQMSKHLVFKRGTDLRFQILRSEMSETSRVGS